MRFSFLPATLTVAALALSACAGLPRERGYAQADALVQARLGAAPDWAARLDATAPPPEIPRDPLGVDDAIALAFAHSPRVLAAYARIGIGRAELDDARRLANPTLGYSRLTPDGGGGSQITRSVSFGLSDLLQLASRKRFANGDFERLQQSVADDLLALASDTEAAWYAAVGAAQIQAMRDLVADAAEHAATLAQRFFDAGNINRLQLELERAAASQARIDAVHAQADALRARAALADLLGLPLHASWRTQAQLPAPADTAFDGEALVALALERRLDLAAARRDVALREDALGVTRRWRWLGDVELGYEREREGDGTLMRGPSLSLGLPIFNQGQGAVGRAQAQLLDARAALDASALDVQNGVRAGIERLALARDIAERYRRVLVPAREAIVGRTQEQVNFMLRGVFELIAAKQAEYDAYQAYLEAVRDYWTARAELRRLVGGALPDDVAQREATIGVEAIVPVAVDASMDHSQHGMAMPAEGTGAAPSDPHAGHDLAPPEVAEGEDDPHAGHHMPAQDEHDPHAGHDMSRPAPVDAGGDPHAGHRMPSPESDGDPHAGHRRHDEAPTQSDE
ncbi:TolC family protein [Chiayiivirga flava]|uniref:Cobalt-zinc-cadmium efflux system outer membrane protein n=1 Tax=Chiayiivirga flava TaxID=659595 RepID=A0A7W8D8E6_9GAMM|nr:TolC family protein [Chiayiivirga flava]MBB5209770.1 cobalt-zinc-cadmium efflux system outer membrane protein [Chiayiivirga flava]